MTPRERHTNNLTKAANRIKRSAISPINLAYYLTVNERTARKYFAELKKHNRRFIHSKALGGYVYTNKQSEIIAYGERLSRHSDSQRGNVKARLQAKRRGYNRSLGV